MEICNWVFDLIECDDELLIQQICMCVLLWCGVFVMFDEIVVMNGCQQVLYLIVDLLCGKYMMVGFENFGYLDVCNIFENCNVWLLLLFVDGYGIVFDLFGNMLLCCDYVYVMLSY